MTDEEYRECIEKLIKGGRQWDAMYELQGYARRHIDLINFAIKDAKAERRAITKICNSDLSTVAKVHTIEELLEQEQDNE